MPVGLDLELTSRDGEEYSAVMEQAGTPRGVAVLCAGPIKHRAYGDSQKCQGWEEINERFQKLVTDGSRSASHKTLTLCRGKLYC